jgi:hypothetical protein
MGCQVRMLSQPGSSLSIILREENTYKITVFGKLLIKAQYDLKVKAKQNNLSIPEECEHGECICNKFFMK